MVRHARKWSSRAHRMAMQRLQLEYAAAGAEILALCERLGKKMDDNQIRKMLRKVGGDDDQIE